MRMIPLGGRTSAPVLGGDVEPLEKVALLLALHPLLSSSKSMNKLWPHAAAAISEKWLWAPGVRNHLVATGM